MDLLRQSAAALLHTPGDYQRMVASGAVRLVCGTLETSKGEYNAVWLWDAIVFARGGLGLGWYLVAACLGGGFWKTGIQ